MIYNVIFIFTIKETFFLHLDCAGKMNEIKTSFIFASLLTLKFLEKIKN